MNFGMPSDIRVSIISVPNILKTHKLGRLSTWLAKGASALDPGRVINISSTASVTPHAEGLVSADGNGTWSCASSCYAT